MTQNSQRAGAIRPAFKGKTYADANGRPVCTICRGSGWELYWRDEYEFARRCTACGGVTPQMFQERREAAGLPSKYNTAVLLKDFDTGIYSQISGEKIDITKQMTAVNDFVNNYYNWKEQGLGLYLYSQTKGSGKSYLASCIANSLIQKYCVGIRYISISGLIDAQETGQMNRLREVEVLIIDDLGAKKTGREWINDLLFNLIDYRIGEKKVTIFTSNIALGPQIDLDDRTCDRINACTVRVTLPEIAVRASKADKIKQLFLKTQGIL